MKEKKLTVKRDRFHPFRLFLPHGNEDDEFTARQQMNIYKPCYFTTTKKSTFLSYFFLFFFSVRESCRVFHRRTKKFFLIDFAGRTASTSTS